jgi:hypothetical protein
MRVMPDFIIIGGQKCGTSSLYRHLVHHPSVVAALHKEVHFFDFHFKKGIYWYRANFPSICHKLLVQKRSKNFATGEASPYYIFHPHVPGRVFHTVPGVRLIALLRNPVDRAYSHYHHEVRYGREPLSFEEAIEKESERLNGEKEKMLGDAHYHSAPHRFYSYLARGVYVDQLKVWMSLFPRENILILRSEDLFADSPGILDRVCKFLNLPGQRMHDRRIYGEGHYTGMQASTRKRLIAYFEPHNERLYRYLGENFRWER